MRGRRVAVAAIAVLLVACSPAGSASTSATASAPTVTRPVEAAPSVSASPQEAALAAYEAYTDAVVTALREGDADLPALEAAAAGQALRNVRRRVAANRDDGVAVTGDLEPSVTAADVQVSGDGDRAEVTDCALNGLAHVDADDPDEVVEEATGWRQPVEARLTRREDGWRVTRVEVPLRDGSGPVPAPPGEAPLLRGPAQAEAPPSCVLPDAGDAAVDAYLGFHDAYNTALGIDSDGPADPDTAALRQTAVEPQRSAAREYLSTLASKGQAVRGEPNARDPWPVAMLDFDDTVFVYDCVTQGDNAIVDVSSGEIVATNDAGVLRLDTAELTRSTNGWKVVSWSVTEEGLEECTSAE